jgi:hypothetical protein
MRCQRNHRARLLARSPRIAVVLPVSAWARSRERSQTVSRSARTTAQPSKRRQRRTPSRCCPSKAHRQARIPVAAVGIPITAAKRKFQRAIFLKWGFRKTRATESKNRNMNQHHTLGMFRQQRGPQIKCIHHKFGNRRAVTYWTATCPVIFGWIEQK